MRLVATTQTYTVEDLGTTSDGSVPSSITGINANGQVSGTAASRPVRFTDGAGFEYLSGVDASTGVGNAINAGGEVAGYSFTASGYRAFRAGNGAPTFVDPADGGSFTFGWAINANGVIAGYGNGSAGVQAFRAAPGATLETFTLSGTSFGFGINDAGQVAGTSVNGDGIQHAYRANPDGTIEDLGSLSATGPSMGNAIDQNGDVVGRSLTDAGVYHAFRATSTGMHDIDTLNSTFSNATALSGAVVVGTFTADDGSSHAFMHTAADGMVDLNSRIPADSGWVLMSATGVNSKGQIVGLGSFNGVTRAYRLTPDKLPDTTAPVIASFSVDPSTIAPPDGRTVAVTVSVSATDDSGEQPTCTLTGITGPGSSPADYQITSDAGGTVRAVGGRTYTFTETCTDAAGNHASSTADVVVPPDVTAPAITSLSATPQAIWPANGKMNAVSVSVTAEDDVDASPSCALSSVTSNGGSALDAKITGAYTADVRASRNGDGSTRVYTLTVTCSDSSGNAGAASVKVAVSKNGTIKFAKGSQGAAPRTTLVRGRRVHHPRWNRHDRNHDRDGR